MTSYFLATGAAWLVAALITLAGQNFMRRFESATISEAAKSAAPRLPLQLLARLAFALVLVYGLRKLAPVTLPWQAGLEWGALAGLLIYLPWAFDQYPVTSGSATLTLAMLFIGILQSAAAGAVAALVFSL